MKNLSLHIGLRPFCWNLHLLRFKNMNAWKLAIGPIEIAVFGAL